MKTVTVAVPGKNGRCKLYLLPQAALKGAEQLPTPGWSAKIAGCFPDDGTLFALHDDPEQYAPTMAEISADYPEMKTSDCAMMVAGFSVASDAARRGDLFGTLTGIATALAVERRYTGHPSLTYHAIECLLDEFE